jgi:hypothetical protein
MPRTVTITLPEQGDLVSFTDWHEDDRQRPTQGTVDTVDGAEVIARRLDRPWEPVVMNLNDVTLLEQPSA